MGYLSMLLNMVMIQFREIDTGQYQVLFRSIIGKPRHGNNIYKQISTSIFIITTLIWTWTGTTIKSKSYLSIKRYTQANLKIPRQRPLPPTNKLRYQAIQASRLLQETQSKMTEHTVLANSPIYPPKIKLISFAGFEGEDFRTFEQSLDNYFALNNIADEKRMLVILKAQLYHAARTFVNKELKKKSDLTYTQVMKKLHDHYITPELIQTYEYAFHNMKQGAHEHPKTFYARIGEAAELADIDSEP
ncbi:hypothetical protein BC941DRAFT_468617 [Chlamydoabsidia padenii]|nr:hypothetical protein BC941DRAFT_468617 [Chlamydoabsidia padenii]